MPNEKDEKNLKETKQAIKKAQENLEEISQDEHERYLAELREKYIRDQVAIQEYGYYKGIDEGIEQGKNEEKIKIAKKMLEKKIDVEIIINVTGLTLKQIQELN